jgi:Flp pilus assembly protein TadD
MLHVKSWQATEVQAGRLRAAAYVLFGLACSCKETALAFVPLIVLLELWLRPRPATGNRPDILAAGRAAVPYVAAAAIYFAVRTAVLGGLTSRGGSGLRTALDSVWNAPQLLLLYAKLMVVPSPLLIQHVLKLVTSAAEPSFFLGAAAIGAGVAGIWWLRRPRPDLAFACCLTLLPLLPALYVPALGRDPFAERYAYLGVAGFCWLLVGSAEALTSRPAWSTPAWVLPAFLYVLLIAAAARTAIRCGDWIDDGTLGKSSVRDEPRAAVGYLLAGGWLRREGRMEEAWRMYQDGLNHVPASPELTQNAIGLGIELHHMSHDDVLATYERLVPLTRESAPAQFNLGHALLEGGRLDPARSAFARALELAPNSVASMTALALIASQRGDGATAISLLERAVQVDPQDTKVLNSLGQAYVQNDRVGDARRVWQQALVIDPGFVDARQNLERWGR